MSIHESIARLKADMLAEGIEPERGLGQELFLFASTLMPVVNVDLLVTSAETAVKGDTATGVTKQVTVETGAKVMVPNFVKEGDTIRVDTTNGNYVTRV